MKNNKTNLKILGATMVTLFSLVTVFTATIAWFSLNKTTHGDGMKAIVTKLSGRLDYVEFHDISTIEETETDKIYHFDKEVFTTITYNYEAETATYDNDDIFVMNDYSPLNQEHPLLVLFAFKLDIVAEYEGDIFIRGNTGIEHFLGSATKTGDVVAPTYPLGTGSPALVKHVSNAHHNGYGDDYYASSSIVDFKYHAMDSTAYATWYAGDTLDFDSDDLYQSVDRTFVNIDSNDPEDVTFNSHPFLYRSPNGVTVKYVAIVVNYYAEAISMIYSTYIGDDLLENTFEGDLLFACDWSMEVA